MCPLAYEAATASPTNEYKFHSFDACRINLSGYDSDDGQPILGGLFPRPSSAPLAIHSGGRAGESSVGAKENRPELLSWSPTAQGHTAASSLDSSSVGHRIAQRIGRRRWGGIAPPLEDTSVEGAVGTSVLSPRPVFRGNTGLPRDPRGPVYVHVDPMSSTAAGSQGPRMTSAANQGTNILNTQGNKHSGYTRETECKASKRERT